MIPEEYHTWIVAVSIPLTCGLVGWFTNWLAVKMIFHPRDYIGIGKLGWQGIIPHHAVKMSGLITRILTERLVTPREIYERIDPKMINHLISDRISEKAEEIVEKIIRTQNPLLWNMLPPFIRNDITNEIKATLPDQIIEIYKSYGEEIDEVFDFEEIVRTSLSGKNTDYLIEMFKRCGGPEFAFIIKSGLGFGILIGLIQLAFIAFLSQWWTMPIMGIVVGYVTNWLALQMIFRPLEPKKFVFIYYQGLFLKRQPEVSYEFADVLEKRVLHAENLIRLIFKGKGGDLLVKLVYDRASAAVEKIVQNKPMVPLIMNSRQMTELKKKIGEILVPEIPEVASRVENYLPEAIDIKATVAKRLSFLPAAEFENLLHSVFKEDELTLIFLGALLGGLAGLIQAALVFF